LQRVRPPLRPRASGAGGAQRRRHRDGPADELHVGRMRRQADPGGGVRRADQGAEVGAQQRDPGGGAGGARRRRTQ
jgi:hypothetical protein